MRDDQPIQYVKGTSASDRRFCRRLITEVACFYSNHTRIIIACSGGIDSSVLVHAAGQAMRIRSTNFEGNNVEITAVYVNHNFRAGEVQAEAEHVRQITSANLSYITDPVELHIAKGSGLQERARVARYEALRQVVRDLYLKRGPCINDPTIWMGHNANDNVETKLLHIFKGKPALGIPYCRPLLNEDGTGYAVLRRPLLSFTRGDIERYARCFKLKWCEDSSNEKDDYTRNKIRHHVIPWIEQNVNPGFVSMMSKEN